MTALTRWHPSRDLLSITEEMNRLVDSVFRNGETRETSFLQGTWTPAADINEDRDNYYLHIELPGMSRDDIKLRYDDGTLVISGEKKSSFENNDISYHRVERSYGKFERSFRITSQILSDKISAEFTDGVLSITLPKAEEVKAKEIEVKIK